MKGGGCSGLAYAMEWAEKPRERDKVFEREGVRVFVDPKSYLYLMGTELVFEESLMGSGFKLQNPNVKAACGCGESFTVCSAQPSRSAGSRRPLHLRSRSSRQVMEDGHVKCWNCEKETRGPAFCPACGKIAARAPGATLFDVFELPPSYDVDVPALEKQFRELSLQLHPDRFAQADARERRLSLEQTTALNEAYKTLKDPVAPGLLPAQAARRGPGPRGRGHPEGHARWSSSKR